MLNNFCKKKNLKTIITGHNLDDQVETFFIRLSRGSGLTGLSAMKPLSKLDKKIRLFRPLLDVKKDSLIKISKTGIERLGSSVINLAKHEDLYGHANSVIIRLKKEN